MERFYFKFKLCANYKLLEKRLINRIQPFWNSYSNPNPLYKRPKNFHYSTHVYEK
jgi:hypothetical protein